MALNPFTLFLHPSPSSVPGIFHLPQLKLYILNTAAKSLQLCPTLCDPIDGSPPGSPVPGILQARTLEWVAISFPNAWKWKVKVKSLSHVRLSRPHGLQPTRLLHPWEFPSKSTGVGCHCLLWYWTLKLPISPSFQPLATASFLSVSDFDYSLSLM